MSRIMQLLQEQKIQLAAWSPNDQRS